MKLNFPYPMQTRYATVPEWLTAPEHEATIFGTNGTQPKTDGIDVDSALVDFHSLGLGVRVNH